MLYDFIQKLTSVILSSLVLSNFLPNVSASKGEIKKIKETHEIYGLIIGNKEEKKKFVNDYLDNKIKSANLEIQELENKLKNPPSTDGLCPMLKFLNTPEELSKSIYSKKSYLKKLEAKSENFKNALCTNNGEPFNILEQHISTHIRARLDVSTLDINDENSETLKPYNFIISIANDIKTDDNLDEHINDINSTISEKKDKNAKIIVQEYGIIDPEIIFYDIQTIYLDDFHEKEKEQEKKEKQTSNSAITNQTNSYIPDLMKSLKMVLFCVGNLQ